VIFPLHRRVDELIGHLRPKPRLECYDGVARDRAVGFLDVDAADGRLPAGADPKESSILEDVTAAQTSEWFSAILPGGQCAAEYLIATGDQNLAIAAIEHHIRRACGLAGQPVNGTIILV